jgi:hypothetical protein
MAAAANAMIAADGTNSHVTSECTPLAVQRIAHSSANHVHSNNAWIYSDYFMNGLKTNN